MIRKFLASALTAALFADPCAAAAQEAPQEVPQLALSGNPPASIAWTERFETPGDDWINDIVPAGEDRYLAVGFLDRGSPGGDWRALAATVTGNGKMLARHEYGAGGGVDAFWSGTPAADGRTVFAGFTTRIGNRGINALAMVARADGRIERENGFGGAGYDRFTDLAPAPDGYMFAGHSQPPGENTKRRLYLVKTDLDGVLLWERIFESTDELEALYIDPAGDGGFVLAGGIGRTGARIDSDILVVKIDAAGKELWRQTVGTPEADDINHGLAVLPDGRIVVTGYSKSWGARDNDILAATLSPGGAIEKIAMLGGAADDRPILAKADAMGRTWIVGYTRSAGAGEWDAFAARLGADGAFEPGVLTLGGAFDDNGTAIRPIDDDSMLIGLYSKRSASEMQDAVLARIDAIDWRVANPAFTARVIR